MRPIGILNSFRTGRLFRRGVRYVEHDEYERALSYFEEVVEHAPEDAAAYNNIGFCSVMLGRHGAAIAAYRRAVELDQEDPQFACDLGGVYLEIGRFENAVAAFGRAVSAHPDFLPARLGLGEALFRQEKHDGAAEVFREIIAKDPHCVDAHTGLGVACLAMERCEEALAALADAVRLNPDHAAAHEAAARVYTRLGRHREALVAQEDAGRCQPFSGEAQCRLAEAYTRAGRWKKALEVYERAVRLSPDLPAAQAGIQEAREVLARPRDGQLDAEKEVAQEDAAKTPESLDEVPSTVGSTDTGPAGGSGAEVQSGERVRPYAPRISGASIRVAAFVDLPGCELTEPESDHGVRMDEDSSTRTGPGGAAEPGPDSRSMETGVHSEEAPSPDDGGLPGDESPDQDVVELLRAGREHYLEERFEEALDCWDQAAQVDPHNATTHNNRAAALFELGRPEEAIGACLRALSLRPGYAVGHATLCEIYAQLGNYEAAIREFEILRDLDPGLAGQVADLVKCGGFPR